MKLDQPVGDKSLEAVRRERKNRANFTPHIVRPRHPGGWGDESSGSSAIQSRKIDRLNKQLDTQTTKRKQAMPQSAPRSPIGDSVCGYGLLMQTLEACGALYLLQIDTGDFIGVTVEHKALRELEFLEQNKVALTTNGWTMLAAYWTVQEDPMAESAGYMANGFTLKKLNSIGLPPH